MFEEHKREKYFMFFLLCYKNKLCEKIDIIGKA